MAGYRFGKAETGVRSAVAAPVTHSWRNGRRSRLRSGRPRGMEVQVLPGAPTFARFAKRPRHRSYTPTFPGSNPGASTNRFVSLAAIAPTCRGPAVRVRDEAPVNSPVAQRQSTRPITGRPRIVTVRENQQQETNMTMTITKPGRLAAVSRSPMDPEAFKPETVGQRAFNPCAKGFNSSRVLHQTRLAQLVRTRSS